MNPGIWDRAGLRQRLAFAMIIATATWLGREHSTADGPATLWYGRSLYGIPSQYIFLAVVGAALVPFVRSHTRPFAMEARLKELHLWPWLVCGGVVLTLTLARALLGEANNLFIDWRNLVVVGTLAWLSATWLQDREWRWLAPLDLATIFGLMAAQPLLLWAIGGGSNLLGASVPVFSSEILTISSLAAIVTLAALTSGLEDVPIWYGRAVRVAAVLSSLLIALAFRRGYWLLLAVGFVGVAIHEFFRGVHRRAAIPFALATTAALVAVSILGATSLFLRLESFNPNADATINQFAATTSDHVGDILDALDVIRENPIQGLGIGLFYETNRIAHWKTESFEVHSAPIHVWLKFGLAGLITYVGFHAAWVRRTWAAIVPSRLSAAAMAGIGIFVAAEFIATLVATWPYGRFQVSILHGVLLGMLMTFTLAPPQLIERGYAKTDRAH